VNRLKNTIDIFVDIVVPESNDAIAFRFKPARALGVPSAPGFFSVL
jgi:hypothetical protein